MEVECYKIFHKPSRNTSKIHKFSADGKITAQIKFSVQYILHVLGSNSRIFYALNIFTDLLSTQSHFVFDPL